jgi:glycine/D-amino acid oxidase-like deaminating enzyme
MGSSNSDMKTAFFTSDFKLSPYWWDSVPPPDLQPVELPEAVDVAVIGSGYTGLHAALQTARGGRRTIVLDAEAAGWGCSTRNGGQISTSVKPGYAELARRHGADRAFRIVKEGQNSLAWIAEFLAAERIDCDFRIAGRFHAAHNPAQYEALARQAASQPKGLEVPVEIVSRADQRAELGTDAYFGGAVFTRHAALDPARYHRGLLDRVIAAGAVVAPHCAVTAIAKEGSGFRVTTARGTCTARDGVMGPV